MSSIHLDRNELADGETLTFTAELTSPITARLHVMYVIASTTARGAPREKVFSLTKTTVQGGKTLILTKKHPLRSTANAKITPGPYTLNVQVNGNRLRSHPFRVVQA